MLCALQSVEGVCPGERQAGEREIEKVLNGIRMILLSNPVKHNFFRGGRNEDRKINSARGASGSFNNRN
jgi:hypothetical protein